MGLGLVQGLLVGLVEVVVRGSPGSRGGDHLAAALESIDSQVVQGGNQ